MDYNTQHFYRACILFLYVYTSIIFLIYFLLYLQSILHRDPFQIILLRKMIYQINPVYLRYNILT